MIMIMKWWVESVERDGPMPVKREPHTVPERVFVRERDVLMLVKVELHTVPERVFVQERDGLMPVNGGVHTENVRRL